MKYKECFICKKEIYCKSINTHIKECAIENDLNIPKDDLIIKQLNYLYKLNISKDWLNSVYSIEELSLHEIKDKYGLSLREIDFLLKFLNIKKRTIKDSKKLKRTLIKYKTTTLERYGVDNISKLESTKEKKKNTFLKNYGVDNIWKSKDYVKWLHKHHLEKYGKKSVPNNNGNANSWGWKNLSCIDKNKRLSKLKRDHAVWWNNLTEIEKIEYRKIRKERWQPKKNYKSENFSYGSNLEKKIANSLIALDISYTTQFNIENKYFDFLLNNTKIILEINGNYWHANPDIYEADELIKYPGKKEIEARYIWYMHIEKEELAENNGYTVINIWEDEILASDNINILILMKLKSIKNEIKKY